MYSRMNAVNRPRLNDIMVHSQLNIQHPYSEIDISTTQHQYYYVQVNENIDDQHKSTGVKIGKAGACKLGAAVT